MTAHTLMLISAGLLVGVAAIHVLRRSGIAHGAAGFGVKSNSPMDKLAGRIALRDARRLEGIGFFLTILAGMILGHAL